MIGAFRAKSLGLKYEGQKRHHMHAPFREIDPVPVCSTARIHSINLLEAGQVNLFSTALI